MPREAPKPCGGLRGASGFLPKPPERHKPSNGPKPYRLIRFGNSLYGLEQPGHYWGASVNTPPKKKVGLAHHRPRVIKNHVFSKSVGATSRKP
jgi:hypothetical protein